MGKVALIATVRDERETIDELLRSLLDNRRQPDEIIITDGGSRDGTLERLQEWTARLPRLRVLSVPGSNRSQGRNRAIEATTAPWIAVTDGGVRLDAGWLDALTRPLTDVPPPDVVAGFFQAAPATLFELALGATTLPLVGEIDGASFLPSSRSVLFSRAAWAAAAGYPEWLDYGEDLVFDLSMRRAGARFVWVPEAIVHFRPRRSLGSFFRQYYRYARGDGKALLWPRRHAIRYASYAGLIVLLWLAARGRRRPIGALTLSMIGLGGLAYLRRPYQRLVRMGEGAMSTRESNVGAALRGRPGFVPVPSRTIDNESSVTNIHRRPERTQGGHGDPPLHGHDERMATNIHPDEATNAGRAQRPAPTMTTPRSAPYINRRARLLALALLPICRLTGDVAKMLGYPVGRLWRWQHGPALPADPTAPRHCLQRG